MPRIPRLGRGEQDAADAPAEQQTPEVTPGDPLAGPPPAAPAPLPEPAPAAPSEGATEQPAADATATTEQPADEAGEPAAEHDGALGFRERARMRRRLREVRRLREIAFRDLGGLTFDLHRFGRDRQDLVTQKLEVLGQLDTELRALEGALDERRTFTELREPGIAACPSCGTLHGTDANFCPGCGTQLRGS